MSKDNMRPDSEPNVNSRSTNAPTEEDHKTLHDAIYLGDVQLVRRLCSDDRINVNEEKDGEIPITTGLANFVSVEVFRVLLQCPRLEVNKLVNTFYGPMTAIMFSAAIAGKVETTTATLQKIELLASHPDCNLGFQGPQGVTVLELAITSNIPAVVRCVTRGERMRKYKHVNIVKGCLLALRSDNGDVMEAFFESFPRTQRIILLENIKEMATNGFLRSLSIDPDEYRCYNLDSMINSLKSQSFQQTSPGTPMRAQASPEESAGFSSESKVETNFPASKLADAVVGKSTEMGENFQQPGTGLFAATFATFGSDCEYDFNANSLISYGRFGVVYKATVTNRGSYKGDRTVAVKRVQLLKRSSDNAEVNKWVTLLSLNHKNIVMYHKVKVNPDLVELMMEYCPGGDLNGFINSLDQKKRLALQQVTYFAMQIAEGLCYLHENNVIHGDLKPANVLLKKKSADDRVDAYSLCIGDLDDRVVMMQNKTCSKDVTHLRGTLRYMSPEMVKKVFQLNEEEPGRKTDIWSFGWILLDLVDCNTGNQEKLLHKNGVEERFSVNNVNEYALMWKIVDGFVPLVRTDLEDWEPKALSKVRSQLDIIIQKCFHENSDQRLTSSALVHDLEEI
ncbi:uncharacterized protein LOC129595066 isoform X2 [Paramacrobiotus metropolitanus]|nr:uncharacterized protein LOC129595066 isoform X2 [Paramacrobiotus metropolitanus]